MESELVQPNTRREKEVWQACDDLWAKSASSRHLTGDNIRDQLLKLGYKRGSPNEIYRYRSSWKESRGISDVSEVQDGDVKASDPISRAVSLVYDQMRTQTSETIDKLTEDYETRLKAALIEEENLRTQLTTAHTQNNQLELELQQTRIELGEAKQQLIEEERSHVVLNERLKASKEQLDAIGAEHRALIAELKAFHEREVDLWRDQNAEQQKSLAELKKQTQAELDKQGARFSDELMKLKTELRQTNEDKVRVEGKLAVFEALDQKEAARLEALEEFLERTHREARTWHQKLERAIQSGKSGSYRIRSLKPLTRRCKD